MGNFCIEISQTQHKMFIAAVSVNNPDKNYLIELDKDTADVILKEFVKAVYYYAML